MTKEELNKSEQFIDAWFWVRENLEEY